MTAFLRYRTALREALEAERRRAGGLTEVRETDFLPAALEVIERPVSPTARTTARLLLGGMVLLLLWLALGRVDIVATAPGRIVPQGQVKLVQPAGPGVVRRILVAEGQHVRKGQPLLLLDPTAASAGLAQAEQAVRSAALDVARAQAVLGALDSKGLRFVAPPETDLATSRLHEALARAEHARIVAGLAVGRGESGAAAASADEARREARKLDETIPLIKEQLDANEALLAKGYVSRLRVIEMRRQYQAALRDREIAQVAAGGAGARRLSAASEAARTVSEVRARLLGQLAEAQATLVLRRAEVAKARRAATLDRLVAPAGGIVTDLAVHTEGGVIAGGRPVMAIVPTGGRLIAEVLIPNREIGFVRVGQRAQLKLEAFPITRYGLVPGRVIGIAGDARIDPRLGPVFPARIALDRQTVPLGARTAAILPGMTLAADIATGRRSLLSYLLSPIEQARLEAARER